MTETLDELVAKMRALGVSKFKSAEVEIELGPEPAAQVPEPDERELKRRRDEAAKSAREYALKTMFAATSMRPRRGT